MTQHNLTQILKVIRDLVMRNRPCYRDYIGNGQYETKLLPEYLLPEFLRSGSVIEVIQTSGTTGGSAIILRSSTADSTKRFRITVDDTGTLKATEVT